MNITTTNMLPEAKFKIFTGLLKAFEGEDGTPRLSGIASSTTRDLHGDVMEETALRDMEAAANSNMTIFLNHSYQVPEDVAGSVTRASVVQRGYDSDNNPNWDLDMDIAINRENDRAVKSWSAIKNGTKLGLSIGAMIPKGGAVRDKDTGALTISRLQLMETSIVSIPANPRSWISNAVKALNVAQEEITPTYTSSDSADTITLDVGVTEPIIDVEVATDGPEITRPTCPDCGGHRNSPKGGCESGFHSKKDVDMSTPQEAIQSEPENGDGADLVPVTEDADLDGLDAVTKASVKSMLALLETTTAKLVDAREQIATEKRAREQAEVQRDEAVRVANEAFTQAHSVFERLAETRIGRKTSFVTTRDDFDHLEGIYSEKFRRLLKQGGS
jgi:phage head maturation protease